MKRQNDSALGITGKKPGDLAPVEPVRKGQKPNLSYLSKASSRGGRPKRSQPETLMRTATLPMHTVNPAQEKGHEFTEETMMKMPADRNQRLHAGPVHKRFDWEQALLTCFVNHTGAGRKRLT